MRSLVRLIAPLGIPILVACGSDPATGPIPAPTTKSITVDASQTFAYVALGESATPVTVADPSSSTAWDLGLFATGVTLNGGAAGPGGVSAYCICQNAQATTAALQGMTPDNQLAAFDAVTTAQLPASNQFVSDQLSPVIAGWYTGTAPNVVAATSASWIIRKGTTTAILGKLRVTSIQNATATA
ncbi:MAG: hypothetical protein ABI877_14315, partial [Gemmatimonadaceae bacterium]